MHGGNCFRTLLLLFWWYWGLNSEPHTCWSSTLPLSDFPSLAAVHYILMPDQIELPVRTQKPRCWWKAWMVISSGETIQIPHWDPCPQLILRFVHRHNGRVLLDQLPAKANPFILEMSSAEVWQATALPLLTPWVRNEAPSVKSVIKPKRTQELPDQGWLLGVLNIQVLPGQTGSTLHHSSPVVAMRRPKAVTNLVVFLTPAFSVLSTTVSAPRITLLRHQPSLVSCPAREGILSLWPLSDQVEWWKDSTLKPQSQVPDRSGAGSVNKAQAQGPRFSP